MTSRQVTLIRDLQPDILTCTPSYAIRLGEALAAAGHGPGHGLKLLVDRESLPFVSGSTIDYEESLQGAGFKVNNPNVVAACGCGSSFRVADEEQVSAV